MKKSLAILIILFLFNPSAHAQKKTADSLVFNEYYKRMMMSMERNLDLLDDSSQNSISFLYIEMSNYKLKDITYDAVDSSATRIFREARFDTMDSLYSKVCRIYGTGNCILVQPVAIENTKEWNEDSKATNTPDIRMLPVFYNKFHYQKEPKYLMELLKIQFRGWVR